jgi:hypothetical protein
MGMEIFRTPTVLACFLVLTASASAANEGLLRVEDFGALGDGMHDDGPAITAAFAASKADGVPSTVVFGKKSYRIGDNPAAWHYFQMLDHEDLVIEGGGATLLCPGGSLAFYFEGGGNITVRGLTFDTVEPSFTQGEVLAVDNSGWLDIKIMEGYPEPPDEAFLSANKHSAHGGGGRHMIVFGQGGGARNTRMGKDHLYISNISRVSPGVFRFHIEGNYVPSMKGVAVGDWASYGFNQAKLSAGEMAAKDRSASTYGQIAMNRVGDVTFEQLDFFGSINGGIRVSDMFGDVTLRKVRIIRKPGTRNLLSVPSDALHLMSIRGKLSVEDCEIEAPGDDCLNIGTLFEKIVDVSSEDPNALTLRTTDNRYYYYTMREGDRLQFLDSKAGTSIGIATVMKAGFDPRSRSHRVVLDQRPPLADPAAILVLNLNQMPSSTVIRNNVMKPYMRNAMLVRAQHMAVEGNVLDGSHGGVHGLNFTTSMGEGARLRDIRISGNTISGFGAAGINVADRYRDSEGALDASGLSITDNIFHVGSAPAIRVQGVRQLTIRGNRFLKDGQAVAEPSGFTVMKDCEQVVSEPDK